MNQDDIMGLFILIGLILVVWFFVSIFGSITLTTTQNFTGTFTYYDTYHSDGFTYWIGNVNSPQYNANLTISCDYYLNHPITITQITHNEYYLYPFFHYKSIDYQMQLQIGCNQYIQP